MVKWFSSRSSVMVLSTVALLFFLGRAFYDWRWEYPKQDPQGNSTLLAALAYLAFVAAWLLGLLAAQQGRRGGLIGLIALALVLDTVFGIATFFILCPPGCEGFQHWQLWNWGQTVSGVVAAASAGLHLREMGKP